MSDESFWRELRASSLPGFARTLPPTDCQNEPLPTGYAGPKGWAEGHDIGPEGGCVSCGASHEQLVDRVAPPCDKIVGPHRLAIIAALRDARLLESQLQQHRHSIAQMESSIAATQRTIREKDARLRELQVSIETLRAAK